MGTIKKVVLVVGCDPRLVTGIEVEAEDVARRQLHQRPDHQTPLA